VAPQLRQFFSFRSGIWDTAKFRLKISTKNTSSLSFSFTKQFNLILKEITIHLMKNLFLPLLLAATFSLKAQYYYQDIISTNETNHLMKSYKDNKVLGVTSTGYDPLGAKTSDFSEQQEIMQNGSVLKTTTRNNLSITVLISRFDDQSRLISIGDSANDVKSSTVYTYDAIGKISLIKNTTKDTSLEINNVETHQWIYNSNGQPTKMLRIVNDNDTTEYRFNIDDKGNVADEQLFRKGKAGEMIYYYYDDNKRLTDIVRYNDKFKKLLPDYMFEYDEQDHVLQKTTLLSNLHLGYLIWRYVYNDKGLKTKEALFNKDKEITGKIEYSYTFAQ